MHTTFMQFWERNRHLRYYDAKAAFRQYGEAQRIRAMTREQIETLVEREGEHITLESPNTSGGTSYFGSQGYGRFYGWAGEVLPPIREPGFTDMSRQRREDMLKLVIRRFVGAA